MPWRCCARWMSELDPSRPTEGLARALGAPLGSLAMRREPEDFVVEEQLGFEPADAGAHLWLFVEKRGVTTDSVARDLARMAGVAQRDIGFSGLKDRWSVSRQWFSLPDSGTPLREAEIERDGFQIRSRHRNARKLRRGTHRANRFRIRLRGPVPDEAVLLQRLRAVAERGVPNYFEAQRFGRRGDNVESARRMFAGRRVDRRRRGLYLSAVRAFLFNAVLHARVRDGSWERILPGEAVSLDGSRSVFQADDPASLAERLARHDVHPSGPLWGVGDSLAQGEALALESAAAAPFRELTEGLEQARVEAMRRPLRLPVRDLEWLRQADCLTLAFTLPAGAFATAVLRELVEAVDERRTDDAQVRSST